MSVVHLSDDSIHDGAGLPDPSSWGLDPLFSTPVKLIGCHLAAMTDASREGDVCWLNHSRPVRYVDMVGTVICIDPCRPLPGDTRVSFTLDDTTALTECVLWLNEMPATDHAVLPIRLGAVIHVLASLGRFRGQRNLRVQRWWPETDPLAEAMHWARAEQLWRECYCKPFQPPRHVSSTTNRLHAPRDVPVPEPSSTALLQQVLRVVRAAARAGGTGGLSAHDIARELWRGGERVAGSSPSAQHDHGSAAERSRARVLQVSDSLRILEDQSLVYAVDERGRTLYRPLSID